MQLGDAVFILLGQRVLSCFMFNWMLKPLPTEQKIGVNVRVPHAFKTLNRIFQGRDHPRVSVSVSSDFPPSIMYGDERLIDVLCGRQQALLQTLRPRGQTFALEWTLSNEKGLVLRYNLLATGKLGVLCVKVGAAALDLRSNLLTTPLEIRNFFRRAE